MKLWICMPVHNRRSLTLACLHSLSCQEYGGFTVVVCDDGSTDGTADAIRQRFPGTVVLPGNGNLWWTGATNRCVEYVLKHAADGDAVVTLNNDLEVPTDYLQRLVNAARRYPHALISSASYDIRTRRLVSPGHRQSWLTSKSTPIDPSSDHLPDDPDVAEITHAAGRGTLIPIDAFKRIGLFDERHLPHYGADYDFAHRARRNGYRVLVCFSARVYSHVEETGMARVRQRPSPAGFYRYLTDKRSPANLRTRWWFAFNNCPKPLLPSYLLLDMFFVIGSYFKYHLTRPHPSPTTRGNS